MLCAVLIPTRGRFDRLLETIESIYNTCNDFQSFRVVIRIDDDDKSTQSRLGELPGSVVVLSGPRKKGYGSLDEWYTDMSNASIDCHWVWIMNDDAIVEGDNWDSKLAEAPVNCIVQPEIMGLGPSVYSRTEGGAFPIVPNQVWKRFGKESIVNPADTWLDEVLRIHNGWKTHWLEGIKVQHNRDNDSDLDSHRKL